MNECTKIRFGNILSGENFQPSKMLLQIINYSQQNTLLNDYPAKMSLVLFDRFGGGFSAILQHIGGTKRAPPVMQRMEVKGVKEG